MKIRDLRLLSRFHLEIRYRLRVPKPEISKTSNPNNFEISNPSDFAWSERLGEGGREREREVDDFDITL